MVKQYGELYLDARRALLGTEDPMDAGWMARLLLADISGKTQEAVLADRDLYASEEVCEKMHDAVKRLIAGEPLAYVMGEWEFYGLPLIVTPDVLIPRDDTCAVVDLALKYALFLPESPRILDLCCGSGCIGLAMASRIPDAKVTLADLSTKALAIAKKNCAFHGLTGRVRCIQANALEQPSAFLGKFDLIISNPPYVTAAEMEALPGSVKDYEPHMALFGGDDGLDFYHAIASQYRDALKPGGYLAFEFGMGQGDDVCAILEANEYTVLERTRDYNSRERAVLAQYGRKDD